MASESVKLMVVEKFKKRKVSKSGREFYVGSVLECGSQVIVDCYVNDIDSEAAMDLADVEPRTKVLVSGVSKAADGQIRIGQSAMVFADCVEFDIDLAVVENFIRPEVVNVSAARGSPKKRRLSVEGQVVEVGPLSVTESFKRRVIKLGECGESGHSISLTLWGEVAVPERSLGTEVTATAVIRSEAGLSASSSTTIETVESDWRKGTVIAVRKSGSHVRVLIEGGTCLIVPMDLVEEIGDLKSKNIEFKVTDGNQVSALRLVD